MKKRSLITSIILLSSIVIFLSCMNHDSEIKDPRFISYTINSKKQSLRFYWRDSINLNYSNFKNLKIKLQKQNKRLVFATNGGMFNKNFSPQGLYIENRIIRSSLDTINNGYGNFYLQPNGVFYLNTDKEPTICTSASFRMNENIEYATQSGPMLVINNEIHSKFNEGSTNLNIRNGVGVLPNGNLIFVMSKEKINFYDFALFFKKNGCKNALYLDGFVSKTYLPSKQWEQLNGEFGVIIAETKEEI